MLSISSQKGFSLVEVVIVGILAALMSGVVFVVLSSAQNQLVDAESGLRVQQISAEVVERIQQVGHNFGFATTEVAITPPCGNAVGPGSAVLMVKEDDNSCNFNDSAWSGFAIRSSGLLVEKPDLGWSTMKASLTADAPGTYTGWAPIEIAGYTLYASNPNPFTTLGYGRGFVVDLGKLHLNSPSGDSIDIPPFKVRCQYRW